MGLLNRFGRKELFIIINGTQGRLDPETWNDPSWQNEFGKDLAYHSGLLDILLKEPFRTEAPTAQRKRYFLEQMYRTLILHPQIHDDAEVLFETLKQWGLCEICPEYTRKGDLINKAVYYIPPEVVLVVKSYVGDIDFTSEFKKFMKIALLACAGFYNNRFKKKHLLEYLRLFYIPEDEMEEIVGSFYKEGITSKYLTAGTEEDPAFFIMDEKRFNIRIKEHLNVLATKILQES